MRVVGTLLTFGFLGTWMAGAQATDNAKVAQYMMTLPAAEPPIYSEVERLTLAASPLGCEDHPHALPPDRVSYLWQHEDKPHLVEEYPEHRAFFGCFDWHSAVNSTWMMVSLIKGDPSIAVAPAIRNELENHFKKENVDGELNYFTHLQGPAADFEKPYGYTWLLKLYGEAKSWNDPDGQGVALALEPLAKWMTEQYVQYLRTLDYPVRVGLHPNTGLTMGFALDYTALTRDTATEGVIDDTAKRLFGGDKHCATGAEPVFGEFASPCLAEAALMGRVLTPSAYSLWLDSFLPPVYAAVFQVYAKEIDAVHGNNRDTTGTDEEGLPNAHLIGLNLQRAADLVTIANHLPPEEPRVAAYRRLASMSAKQGFAKIGQAGYLGTHWLSTYALLYENLVKPVPSTPAVATKVQAKVNSQ